MMQSLVIPTKLDHNYIIGLHNLPEESSLAKICFNMFLNCYQLAWLQETFLSLKPQSKNTSSMQFS